jgi:hypothetical protein
MVHIIIGEKRIRKPVLFEMSALFRKFTINIRPFAFADWRGV